MGESIPSFSSFKFQKNRISWNFRRISPENAGFPGILPKKDVGFPGFHRVTGAPGFLQALDQKMDDLSEGEVAEASLGAKSASERWEVKK